MKLYGREYTKEEIRERVGDLSQIAGIKPYKLKEGPMDGVDAFDVKTGSGFNFTVLPGRAMDIAWMDHNGRSIGYITKSGVRSANLYQSQGSEWLRNFNGGVVTTCGLTHVGPPESDESNELGMHGRVANIPASEVSHKTYFEGDNLVMKMEGKVREAVLFSENLQLSRTITAYGGENEVHIEDIIENQGYEETPLMLLYHMNLGFPLISENSRLVAPIIDTAPRDSEARKGVFDYDFFQPPVYPYNEQVFFHGVSGDEDGNTVVGIVNDELGFGFYISFNIFELPYLTQWKVMAKQDYVVGIEPGNCTPIGRKAAQESGMLEMLEPGEAKKVSITMGVLTSKEEIKAFDEEVKGLKSMTDVDID